MIVVFKPGGTVNNVQVVLKFGEKLPLRFNTVDAEVFMEGEEETLNWTLVKPQGDVLPPGHFMLSESETPRLGEPNVSNVLNLTNSEKFDIFEHRDIIKIGEKEDASDSQIE